MKKILFLILILSLTLALGADTFTDEFYIHVNTYRKSLNLEPLEQSKNAERVAYTYSVLLSEKGIIDHYVISLFEFKQLCKSYNVVDVGLREILARYPDGKTPYNVFTYFLNSESHRKAMIDNTGEYIGAGYYVKNNVAFFTAYIILKD